MKKYIVISVNENPEYLFYLPLVLWTWKKFGFTAIVFYLSEQTDIHKLIYENSPNDTVWVKLIENQEYNSATIAQISRLYAACIVDNGYLLTSDADMLPLSDYWKFDENEITVWGHDLTGYQHYPICYIGMPATRWREVMGLTSDDYNSLIKRDLDSMPNAKSLDSEKRWVVDQDLITERINAVQFKKIKIERGSGANGYPLGRVDRSAWSLNHSEFIDCHMPRQCRKPENMAKMLELLHHVWPSENFGWFVNYGWEFQNLLPNG